jgi:hypothetical protein
MLVGTEHQVLIGSLLGDAHLYKGLAKAAFRENHSAKQLDYLAWKVGQLPSLRLRLKEAQDGSPYATSLKLESLYSYYSLFYGVKGKHIPWALMGELEALGLAVWVADDGCMHTRGRTIRLATCCFTYEEHIQLLQFFESQFGLRPRIDPISNRRGYHLVFPVAETKRLVQLIEPHMPSCMAYKLAIKPYK